MLAYSYVPGSKASLAPMSDTESADARQSGNAEPSGPEPACDECRIRKVRCDRESPLCSSCRKSGLICQYTQKGKRINHTKKLSVSMFPSPPSPLEC